MTTKMSSASPLKELDTKVARLDRKISLGRATRADITERNDLARQADALRGASHFRVQ